MKRSHGKSPERTYIGMAFLVLGPATNESLSLDLMFHADGWLARGAAEPLNSS
jgi:hypothetical protein